MEMKKVQAAGIIIGKLMSLGGMLQRQGNRMLLPFNLNHQQFAIFFEIAQAGRVKQKDMVNRLLLEKPHVSKVVKKLQQMELIAIEEDQEDRRSYWLSLTRKGGETLGQCTAMFREWNADWITEIDETEIQSIMDNLTILQAIFKERN